MTVTHYSWERLVRQGGHVHSHPAHNVSVGEWRRFMGMLPIEEIRARATHGGIVYHPMRINLKHEHVKRLVLGKGLEVNRSQISRSRA